MILSSIVVLASLTVVYKLLTYSRCGANYRIGKSVLAYLLIFSFGAQAIDVLFNGASVNWVQAIISVTVAWLAIKSDGNVALIAKRLKQVTQ